MISFLEKVLWKDKPTSSKEIEQLFERKDTFVISLDKITKVEKFGSLFSPLNKQRFVRFCVTDNNETAINYSKYSNSPSQQGWIQYVKWYDAIREAAKV